MAEYAALKELTLMAPEAMHGAPLPIAWSSASRVSSCSSSRRSRVSR